MIIHNVFKSVNHSISLFEEVSDSERFFIHFHNYSENKDIFFTSNQKNYNKLINFLKEQKILCDLKQRNIALSKLWKSFKKYSITANSIEYYKNKFSII